MTQSESSIINTAYDEAWTQEGMSISERSDFCRKFIEDCFYSGALSVEAYNLHRMAVAGSKVIATFMVETIRELKLRRA